MGNRRAIARRLPAHTAAVTAAATAIVDGRPVAVTGGCGDGDGDILSGEDSAVAVAPDGGLLAAVGEEVVHLTPR